MRIALRKLRRLLEGKSARRVRSAYKRVFLSPEGKIVLADLAREAAFFDQLAIDSANETYYRLGNRGLFLYVLDKIDQSGDDLALAVHEGVTDVLGDTEAA